MLINKKEYYLKTGDLLYIPKNSVVFTHIPYIYTGFESFNVLVPHYLTNEIPGLNSYEITSSPFAIWQSKSIMKIFHSFKQQLSNNEYLVRNQTACFLSELTNICKSELYQTKSNNDAGKKDNEKMIQVLIDNIYSPISMEQMAQCIYMSLSTFKRKFESVFGEAPKTWIRKVRLETAYFQLKTSNVKVSEVSDLVGFQNLPHFSYAFKKHFSMSPSEVLAQN